MTAPGAIPFNPPRIGTTGVLEPQVPPGIAVLMQALQHRQELDIQRQRLRRDQEQLELQRSVAGPQIEAAKLEIDRRRREMQAAEDDLKAKDQAYQIVVGNLPRLMDNSAWGEVVAGVKDPAVAAHVMSYRDQYLKQANQAAETQRTSAQATALEMQNQADVATREILGRYGTQLRTTRGQRDAIAEVASVAGPEEANRLASAFNTGAGRYQHWAGPDGFLYLIDSKTGDVRQNRQVGVRGQTSFSQEGVKRGASSIVELIDEATALLKQDPNADIEPRLARTAENARVLGIPLGAFANDVRTPSQQQFSQLRTRFAHIYVGLLPHSRSAAKLLENLTESFWAAPGANTTLRAQSERDRRNLRQMMADVAAGKLTDLSRIPGFAEAMRAAAAEGTETPQGDTTATPNYDDYRTGPPQ